STTRAQLAEAERGEADQAREIGVERAAREVAEGKAEASEKKAGASKGDAAASERRAQEANDALAKLSAKADERGMVITLSGSVLFGSNDADLRPAAFERLDEVASALIAQGQSVVVEGYTDSRGSRRANID